MAVFLWVGPAFAQDPPAPEPEAQVVADDTTEGDSVESVESVETIAPIDPAPIEAEFAETDDVLSKHRTGFDVLTDRSIGTTSRPVEFNWRRSPVHLAVSGTHLFELNNFNSMRGGALVRLPTGGMILEFGLNYAGTWDSPSSRLLALTPYRQAGRPNRAEVDFAVGVPLAEGVVTTFPRFFPAVQMVFNGYAGLRYSLYPTGFGGLGFGQIASAVLSPSITDDELANLDDARLDAMLIDRGRYGLMVGFGNDLYFKPGLFLSPRLMLAIPLLAPATQTELLWWADVSMAIGLAL